MPKSYPRLLAPRTAIIGESTGTPGLPMKKPGYQPRQLTPSAEQTQRQRIAQDQQKSKAYMEAGLDAASYLRLIPTPITQGIGWGATALGSAIDANDSRNAAQAGNYGEAAIEGGSAVLNLLPLGRSAKGMVGTIDLLKAGSKAKRARTAHNLFYTGTQIANATTDAQDGLEAIRQTVRHAQGGRLLTPRSFSFKTGGELAASPQRLLNLDGSVQAEFTGDRRIHSRAHTRQLVSSALKSKTAQDHERLGRLVTRIWDGHDKAAPDYAKP